MANSAGQENEANPIAEIFDEMFTLLQDLETRSVAAFEYIKEQSGATDEELTPYLDRAAAASDVRWRAARARMEYLLAPKPKSTTEVGKDEKAAAATRKQREQKDPRGKAGNAQEQEENQREKPAQPNAPGDEFALAHPATKSSNPEDDYTQDARLAAATTKSNTKKAKRTERKQDEAPTTSGAKSQASALARGEKSVSSKNDESPNIQAPSENEKSKSQSSGTEKQKGQRAAT